MFAKNKPVKKHNETHLNEFDSQLLWIGVTDKFPKDTVVSESQIDATKQSKISDTGNLAGQSELKIAQVMLNSNLDLADRLMNGLVGSVTQFKYLKNSVSVTYVKVNDDNAGLVAMQFDMTGRRHSVPIKKHEALFGFHKK